MPRTLTALERPRRLVMRVRWLVYTKFWRMDIHPSALISLKAHLDKTYPRGLHIGEATYVTFGAVILTHDRTRGLYVDTYIGQRCFIGARSIIMPGVRVGDGSIVAAGAVVTKDVPARSVVAGNPAIVVREGVELLSYGRFRNADDVTRSLKAQGKYRP